MLVNDAISLRREECSRSLLLFAKIYFQHYLTINHCGFHKELCAILEEMTEKRGARFALAAPRMSAKSTFVSCIYVLWSICYAKEKYIILISDIQDQADKLLKHVKDELESNQFLCESFPEACLREDEARTKVWTKNKIETKNGVRVEAYGTFGKVRGQRHKQYRPTLIILDDIENDENTQSPRQMTDLDNWFNNAILLGNDRPNIVLVGTIHTYGCLLAKYTQQNQTGWTKKIYKSIIQPASNQPLWERWKAIYKGEHSYGSDESDKAAREFFEDNKKEMIQGAVVLWPEQEDYYALMKLIMDTSETYFNREKQNEPIDTSTSIFKWDKIRYWDDEFKNEEELRSAYKGSLTYHLACDPSLGRPQGDYTAIIVLAKHTETKRVFVLVADIEKRPPNKTIEVIIELAVIYPFKTVMVETVQFQDFLADEVRDRAAKREIDLTLVKVLHSGTSKKARIESLEPGINNGRIMFSRKGQGMLIQQLKYFPNWANDDGPDALEMAVSGALKADLKGPTGWASLNDNHGSPEIVQDETTDDPNRKNYGDKYNPKTYGREDDD